MYRICHIEDAPINGMPRVWRAAESAKSAGAEVIVIGEGDDAAVNGIQFIGFGKVRGRFKRLFVRSSKMVQAALETHADIIQLHAPEHLLYALKLKRAGKKVLFDSHEDYPAQIMEKEYIPAPLRNAVARMYAAVEGYICKRIDGVIYPCTFGGKNIFEGRSKRALKIENYSKVVPSFLPGEVKRRQVIYAGTLSRGRGITQLAQAIMKTDGELLLCGPFVTESYREEIMKSFPPSKVKYMGNLGRKELFDLYAICMAGASVLLPIGEYPNVDNLNTKVYEFMQCGLPVITSDFHYAREANDRWHFGVCVDPENVNEIANAIQYLFDHPDEAQRMGENGRRAVKEEFNWEYEEKKLLALYEELLKE